MSEIKMITPEEIVAAYDKTEFCVGMGGYFVKDGKCACGLGAYAAANLECGPHMESFQVQRRLHRAGLDSNYLRGFAWGFDGDKLDDDKECETSDEGIRFMLGYRDGQAAWDAVKGRYKG